MFVLAFKHDLNPLVKTTLQIAASLINNLKPNQRKQLQVDLFGWLCIAMTGNKAGVHK